MQDFVHQPDGTPRLRSLEEHLNPELIPLRGTQDPDG